MLLNKFTRKVSSFFLLTPFLMVVFFMSDNATGQKKEHSLEQIKNQIQQSIGQGKKVDSIRRLDDLNLYEVVIDSNIIYTNLDATFLISGDIFDIKTKRNLTENQREKIAKNLISPSKKLAIKRIKGNGKKVLYTFEDPYCGYCAKLNKNINELENTTIYTFIIPIISDNSKVMAQKIWCNKNPDEAWSNWMESQLEPDSKNCDAPINELEKLARRLMITGTPILFSANGMRQNGYAETSVIEKLIDE